MFEHSPNQVHAVLERVRRVGVPSLSRVMSFLLEVGQEIIVES